MDHASSSSGHERQSVGPPKWNHKDYKQIQTSRNNRDKRAKYQRKQNQDK